MDRKNRIVIGIGAVLIVIGFYLFSTLHDAGEFKTIVPHFDGKCTAVKAPGPEDITIDPDLKIAFISSDDRRAAQRGQPVQGAIYAYDLDKPGAAPRNLTSDLPFDFHPHGIYLYRSPGEKLLFVVNHRKTGEFIEIFEVKGADLRHRESINGPLMTAPNDIVAVGPRQFYVTNDHGSTSAIGKKAEEYLQLKLSYVLFYDGKAFRKAAEEIAYANGIAMSPDGGTVYVASPVGSRIKVYERSRPGESLRFREDIKIKTGVDNIEVDGEGSLWAGCHPKLLTLVKHERNPSKLSPSQVLKITRRPTGGYAVSEIYLNGGREVSSSTVGVPYLNRLLIGSVFDDHFLDCTAAK